MNLHLDIQVACAGGSLPDAKQLERWVSAALSNRLSEAELSIRIVDHEESRKLNFQYRQQNKPTNVLSFPVDLPAEVDLPLLGDIVVCAPLVAEEARQQHKAPESHWAHMIVHGTLHLVGYDHAEEEDARIMEELETEILTGMNYPPPYEQIYQQSSSGLYAVDNEGAIELHER